MTTPPFRLLSLPVVSWALYDLANTIFSFSIGSAYFNPWVIVDKDKGGNPDWYLAAMTAVVTVLLVLSMPVFGALADRAGRRKPFLIGFTVVSVAATMALGFVDSTLGALVLAGIGIFGFQSALAHYDPMLATVAPPERQGSVSGFGVGIGYVGSFIALFVLGAIVGEQGDKQLAFLPTGIMYLVFSLPIVLFVHERVARNDHEPSSFRDVAVAAMGQLGRSIRHLGDFRDIGRLLLARFLYVDALAVVILYMSIYIARLEAFSDFQTKLMLGLAIIAAIPGAMVAGRIVERVGPKRVLVTVIAAFGLAILIEALSGSPAFMWIAAPVLGVSLGAVWTSDRVFMLRLTPPSARGEFFGLYNLIGKVSSAVGPIIWGATLFLLHDRSGAMTKLDASRVALVALVGLAAVGLWVLKPLSDRQREWPDDPLIADVAAVPA